MKAARVAFSGSGSLAGIHAGAASAIWEAGYEIVEVAGTSGGSIVAAAIACGMRDDALHCLAVYSDMSKLLNENVFKLFLSDGMDSGDNLYQYLDHAYGRARMRDAVTPLRIVATDVAGLRKFVFDSQETPDVPMALAVRASCAVPMIYSPVSMQEPISGRMMQLSDGGLMDNIPGDQLAKDDTRFAIEIADSGQMQDISTKAARVKAYIRCMLGSSEDAHMALEAATGVNIITVPATEDPLNFKLPSSTRADLYLRGYMAAKTYIGKM